MVGIQYTREELDEFSFYRNNGFKLGELVTLYYPDDPELSRILDLDLRLRLIHNPEEVKKTLQKTLSAQMRRYRRPIVYEFVSYVLPSHVRSLGVHVKPRIIGKSWLNSTTNNPSLVSDHRLFKGYVPKKTRSKVSNKK